MNIDLEPEFVGYIRFVLGRCHVVFPCLVAVARNLHIRGLFVVVVLSRDIAVVVGLYWKFTFYFPFWLVRRTIQESYGSCDVTRTSGFNVSFSENSFDQQGDKMRFLPKCRYQIKLLGDFKKSFKNWTHAASTANTWTAYIHFSSTDSVAKLFSRVDNSLIMCREHITSTNNREEWTDCTASQNGNSWGKVHKTFVELLPGDQVDSNHGINFSRQNWTS